MARVPGSLAGRRIAVTRAPTQAADLLARLRERGAEPLAYPTIEIRPPTSYAQLDAALRTLDQYDWAAFTSANAVIAVADRLGVLGVTLPEVLRLAAVGVTTGRALIDHLRAPDFMPSTARAETLGSELDDISGHRVLFPHGDLAGDALGRALRARGAVVDEIIAYRTVAGNGAHELARLVREGDVDAILFMSASSVRHLLDALTSRHRVREPADRRPAVICIGPETARAASEGGLHVSAVANEKTASGVVAAVEQWFGREEDGARR